MEEKTEQVIETVQTEAIDENVTYTEVKDPYGFIYITTNLIDGMRYLGKRQFTTGWQNYLGSGKFFQKALKKYKRENFKRDVVCICYSPEELNKAEYDISVFFNVVESSNWYNLVLGGGGMSGYHLSDETRKKIGDANRGRSPSEESRKRMGDSHRGEKNYWYGKTLPDDVREKISNSRKGKYTGQDNPNYGNHKLAGQNHPNYGKPISEEQKQKMRATIGDSRKGEKNANYGNHKLAGFNNPRCTPVYCIQLNEIFWGATAAYEKYGFNPESICACCTGKYKSSGKHPDTRTPLEWKYIYDKERNNGEFIQGAISLGYITEEQVKAYFSNLKQKGNDSL